jgi:hypothetical protein
MPCALGLATYTLSTEAELSSETFVPNKLDGVIFQKTAISVVKLTNTQ